MRVFVTGGTGYIGRHLIPLLLDRGHKVRVLVRKIPEARVPAECEQVPGDALMGASFAESVKGCDCLVHLVGVPHPDPSKADEFRRVDLASARAAAMAAHRARVPHFIFVSVAQPAPVMRAYVQARREAEAAIRELGLRTTVLRPWYVLGPDRNWPRLLLPLYWLAAALPFTYDQARRLGLVELPEMLGALLHAVENPPGTTRIVTVPEIRAQGGAWYAAAIRRQKSQVDVPATSADSPGMAH